MNQPAAASFPLIQTQRHITFGLPFTAVIGAPAANNVGTLGASMLWPEDGVLDSIHVEYGAGVAYTAAGLGIGDVAGAWLVEGVSSGNMTLGAAAFTPGVLWSRADNFLGSAAGNFQQIISTSADISYNGKVIRQNTSFSIYLTTPSLVSTTAQYGVQVTFNYWSMDAYRSIARNPLAFLASIK